MQGRSCAMAQYIKSPICKALWTHNCHDPDRKYPDRHGIGYFSITGNFQKEQRNELEKLIIAEIGSSNAGTYHFKSDSNGGTDVKFKAKETIRGRDGKDIIQRPPVMYKGKQYNDHFEHADVHILFTPKLYKAYNKCSLILRGVEIVELADDSVQTPEEHDIALLKQLGAMNGDA